MLDLVWRPRAHLDRESIAIYLGVECDNPDAALAAMRKIDQALQRVRELPDSGGHYYREGLDNHDYRTVLANPYTIYYRYDATALTVYRILHQRQDLDDYTFVEV